ncbi:MAG: MscS Mechanosensitive ion channel [Peptococcaceae bacterium]|jgi:small conductance mechanosensitive channel|nr:MscS Mechanosensitive ion channel [Peptococcaceae bacterium]
MLLTSWASITFFTDIFKIEDLKLWGTKALMILLILVVARIVMSLGYLLIERVFRVQYIPGKISFDERKKNTLKALLKSVLRYAIYFIAAITILDELNVPVTAVLSAAGILGLAVGFGAQNLVRDVITGFFILFEDQFSVGEYIETAGVGGIVEEVGLRATKLRDWGGQLHIIPNGEITKVTNHNRGSMRALVEVGIAYEEDINHALKVLGEIAKDMARDYAQVITEGPDVLGIVNFGQSEVLIRIIAKTKPMEQWAVEREMRRRIKETFDKEGIEIPYPRRVYIQPAENEGRKKKQGTAE